MFCVVADCRGKDREDIRTFQLPTNARFKAMWLDNLKLDRRKRVTKWSRVCSRHFEDDCILNKKLREGAMPTVDLGHNDAVHQSEIIEHRVKWKRNCAIKGCLTSSPPENIMYSFPAHDPRRQQWFDVCTIKERCKHLKKKFICKQHFREEDRPNDRLSLHAIPVFRLHGDMEKIVIPPSGTEMQHNGEEIDVKGWIDCQELYDDDTIEKMEKKNLQMMQDQPYVVYEKMDESCDEELIDIEDIKNIKGYQIF